MPKPTHFHRNLHILKDSVLFHLLFLCYNTIFGISIFSKFISFFYRLVDTSHATAHGLAREKDQRTTNSSLEQRERNRDIIKQHQQQKHQTQGVQEYFSTDQQVDYNSQRSTLTNAAIN
jgi:hypothetical protein